MAAAIEARDPASADENAALIAEHLEAAGELQAAFDWHMRAGAWSTNRDIKAARLSWERARRVADILPGDHPDCLTMRIAARTLLCANAWRVAVSISGAPFEAPPATRRWAATSFSGHRWRWRWRGAELADGPSAFADGARISTKLSP